ncbi:amino acid racemase [Streptomyces sp. NP160]|uniref:aspartate/glutamate racemase family protein n=1 Tax=Streptomyces sp. NP160 TaxID=2586637 RepID=UPI00111B6ACE|nr:amino acid racemase [Streptomyces sp. NP160]TNM61110.1 amino acid racemase [Streptomyces sp. NP160]
MTAPASPTSTTSTTTVGVLGGMSWESTALYYRLANELVRDHRAGGTGDQPGEPLASADLLVRSLDFAPVRQLQLTDRWDAAAEQLRREGLALAGAGAGVVVVATNYMHKAAGPLEEALAERGATFLHLADVVARAALARGARTVGLLGAGGTMTEPFYAERLAGSGVEVVVPDAAGVARVDAAVFGELCRGVFSPGTRADVAAVVADLAERGAQAVGLCCTELELLLGPDDAPAGVPLLPSARLHVEAALAASGQVPAAGPVAALATV